MDTREASRRGWTWPTFIGGPQGGPTVEQISAGSLQRIADSLERLADLMDPRVQAEVATKEQRAADSQSWNRYFNVIATRIQEAIPATTTGAPAYKVASFLMPWSGRPQTGPFPTKAQIEAVEAFNPLTFDWSKVWLSKVARTRIEAAVASKHSENRE